MNHSTNLCQNCSLGLWPDAATRTRCFALPREALEWTEPAALFALVLALVGLLATSLTTAVFLRFNSTPVVKSTTRELSYIILAGIAGCYAATFALLARPSFLSCFLARVLPPIAFSSESPLSSYFSVVYGALLTKTNRIARILAGSKKRILTKKPRFLSTFSQVVGGGRRVSSL